MEEKSCMNCQKLKSGECGWKQPTICQDYHQVSKYYENNRQYWPYPGETPIPWWRAND